MRGLETMMRREVAADDDRYTADYIRDVRAALRALGETDDEKLFSCMASVLVECRNNRDVKALAADIAENG